jgi:hypothetical protein
MNILEAIDDPQLFGSWFRDPASWAAWRTFMAALFALPMSPDQLQVFRECTGRAVAPTTSATETWLVCGRRAGKSSVLALCAVFLAVFKDWRPFLAAGERGYVVVLAADRRQARGILGYIKALLAVPMLSQLVARESAEEIELTNHISIEVATSSYRTIRGRTIIAALCDEIAFWTSDNSTNPDYEILTAIRPAMSTVPGAMLLCASSPYARRGAMWDAYSRWYGKDDGPLIWQAPTLRMNPNVPQAFIDEEYARDPASAAAEYGAEFRTDIERLLTRESVQACIQAGLHERRPERKHRYVAFVDPSGGSADSMTLAVAHKEGSTAILDCVREVKPPFNPEAVVSEFASLLRSYRIVRVIGDRWGGEWVRQEFRKAGLHYEVSEHTKSELYLSLVPLLNAGAADLLDNPRLITQLVSLERRTSRGGRDAIDHPPGAHDDIANAVAGALVSVPKHDRARAPDIVVQGPSGWRPHSQTYGRQTYRGPW